MNGESGEGSGKADRSGQGPATFLIISGIVTGLLSAIRIFKDVPAAAASGNPAEYQQAVFAAVLVGIAPFALFALAALATLPGLSRLRSLRQQFPGALVFGVATTIAMRRQLNSAEIRGLAHTSEVRSFKLTLVSDAKGFTLWRGWFRPTLSRQFEWSMVELVATRNISVGPRTIWVIAIRVITHSGSVDLELGVDSETFAGYVPRGEKGVVKIAAELNAMRDAAKVADS